MDWMTKKRPQIIKDMFPIAGGVFQHMDYQFRSEVVKSHLDIMFVSNYGRRNPSPVVETIQEEEGRKLTDAELTVLATLLVETYRNKWDKLGAIYDIEYDPIHNYLDEWSDTSDEEKEANGSTQRTDTTEYGKVDTLSNTRTDNLQSSRTVDEDIDRTRTDNLTELETRNLASSDARTDNLTQTNTYGHTTTRTDNLTEVVDQDGTTSNSGSGSRGIYGFNSNAAVNADTDADSNTGSSTNDVTTHNTGTQASAESGSDGVTNTGTQSHTGTDTGTVTTANTGTERVVTDRGVTDTTRDTGTRQVAQTDTLSGEDTTERAESVHNTETAGRERSGSHFGNIGNLTSQKQILEEIALWKWNYVNAILEDVKEFCTVPIYLNQFDC